MSSTGSGGEGSAAPAGDQSADARTSCGVVIVDGDAGRRARLCQTIDSHTGFHVLASIATGDEALEACARLLPAIVVLDLSLPELVEHGVLSRLRERVPWIRVVVHSVPESHAATGQTEVSEPTYIQVDADIAKVVGVLEHIAEEPPSVSWRLEPTTANVSAARRITAEVLTAWGCDDLMPDAKLVVTELVTNAIVHARSPFVVALRLHGDGLRIEVTDEAISSPEPQPFDPEREGGRGLLIVSALSTAWGVDPSEGGKTVWADLVA